MAYIEKVAGFIVVCWIAVTSGALLWIALFGGSISITFGNPMRFFK